MNGSIERSIAMTRVTANFLAVVLISLLCFGLWSILEWASPTPPRPTVHRCTEFRVLRDGVFNGDMRCERWSDGKTRDDVFRK